MIKLSNIRPTVLCYCSSLLRIPVRTKKKKTDKSPIVHKWLDDKNLFGPLLDKKEKKTKKKEDINNEITSVKKTNTVNENNYENEDNDYSLSELHWVETNLKVTRIQIAKHDHTNSSWPEKESILPSAILETQHSNHTQVNRINDEKFLHDTNNSISRSDNNSSLTSKKINDVIETSNFTFKISDTSNIPTKSVEDSIPQNFPLINTAKCNDNQWTETKIVSTTIKDKKHIFLPGVTRILNETASEETKLILEKWKQKMITQLGEIGFEKYMKDQQENSKLMHSLIADLLHKKPTMIPTHLIDTFRSMNLILKNIDNVRFLESHVIHSDLRYRGIIDCVAYYRGNLCLIDWKKSDKIKTLSTTYDLPLQLSAYVGALNSDPNYPFKVKMAVLAIAYSGGQPPSVFEFSEANLQFYWKEWLKRLEKYYSMKSA